ncbi:hypothetical protein GFK26_32650 [Variovorax paradoxus]|uniref:Uncharacterized protein n=1 Tax=Variovorax paradoxus TaxID=34073 RepID=A0A5Q0MC33_VARPD|nr:hypothetical protein GFK26_32650 [Variovorax paradoxus]
MTMHEDCDGILHVRTRTTAVLALDEIKSIGIENMLDIRSYTITPIVGSVSHFIRFLDGGEVRLAYNAQGCLLEFSAQGVAVEIQDGNRLTMASLRRGCP